MGESKALLPWGGESLLRHAVRAALDSRCARVFVVLGAEHAAHERALRGLEVSIVQHEGWREGIGSSIAAGAASIMAASDWEGVAMLLCDQPFISAELLDALIAARESEGRAMAACRYAGTLGPPAVFDGALLGELSALVGDRGAKALLTSDPSRVAIVDFPDGEFDIDTRDDYDRALARMRSRDDAGA
jgi:molybdenum cofactor cytidylyltransferase